MAMNLFDGSDSENDDISKIEINQEYARRFEHNKKREELHRFEELKKKGVIDSPSHSGDDESESESSDDDLKNYNPKSDKVFFDVLNKVKKKDPIIKEKDVKFFESDDSSEDESGDEKSKSKDKKKRKAKYLKDVVAEHLIEEGADFGGEEEETNGKLKGKKAMSLNWEETGFVNNGKKTYGDEQEELLREFREAEKEALGDGEEGDFLILNEKAGEDKEDSVDPELEKKLDEYFSGDAESNENSRFLRNYFRNKMWLDNKGENLNVGEEDLEEISEDEMEIERQEEYEHRFQENPGDRVLGHARKVEGSVRKKTNTRKEQRNSKEERMAIAQKEREEELKHLKNVKKQEIQEKVKKIMKTAGIDDEDIIPLSAAELEEEFDPEEYDRMMKKAFDEKYYNAEDANPEFCSEDEDMEKPDFEKEDELLGLPKGWDEPGSDGGFLAAREKALKEKIENTSDDDLMEEENEEEEIPEEGSSRKRKRKVALLEKARQAMMDEYYKLDFEDTIGDLKTRFKYTKTKPSKFGIGAPEILLMDDKELNQYISLKKLAPYQEEEWKLSKQKRYMLKMRAKEILRAASMDRKKNKKSKVDSSKSTKDGSSKLTSSNNVVEDEKENTANLVKKKKKSKISSKLTLSNNVVEDEKSNTASLDKKKNKKTEVDSGELTSSDRVVEDENTEGSKSRKARRKEKMAPLKLSEARLKAYGKQT
ncbi:protein KRI1 homolog isoform X1 [Trifolium pratense]|uniref:protein KRI1 homolog isoform X1 n=1 Tax=Trifolium pratense TaxID=57577 RepID=UPI001E691295|nr:protein KRI1 homolog isoform X1 [Trifolium pratense]XP_045805136.1 protein KRI1 homolog isoform X1 [Trifolium pratense]